MKYVRDKTILSYFNSPTNVRLRPNIELDYYLWCINRFHKNEIRYECLNDENNYRLVIKIPDKKILINISIEMLCQAEYYKTIPELIYKYIGRINGKVEYEEELLSWMHHFDDYDFIPFKDFHDRYMKEYIVNYL